MNAALILLERADKLDGYETACRQSPINSLARRFCQYIPWPDQSLAKKIESSFSNIRVIILSPSADGGMPHTRAPNIICLPAYFPEEKISETIRHELVHLSQRQNPERWRKRLLASGWTPVSEYDLPEYLVQRTRINPDTYDARFWAWEGRYVPMPLFEREDKPDLREISVRWWDMKEERLQTHQPTSFTQIHGTLSTSQIEHPFELFAYEDSA